MNREERRKAIREYAKDKEAEKCPLCNHKSLFISVPMRRKTKITERERLVELLRKVDQMRLMRQGINECADYLLANGVIALPKLQFRQTLYLIYDGKIRPLEVTSYTVRPEFGNMLQIHLYRNGFNGCCTLGDFGKTVFLTKEEAEKALKERENNG